MSILIGAGVPSIQAYYQSSGYQDVQNRAETIFYAAQHTVTSMTSSTQMDLFIKKLQNFALPIDNVLFPHLGIVDDSIQQTRYYAIRFQKSDLNSPSVEGQMVIDLLDNLVSESSVWNASIAIEIDLYTYTIQTVFYSLADSDFNYGLGSGISLLDRSEETLRQIKLGMAKADLSVKVLSLGTEVSQEPFRVPEIVGDVSWTNPETGEGWWEDDHMNLVGTAWVVTDPTITPTNPIPVQLTLSGATLIKSFRINWWSPINGPVITYQYYLWYRQQNSTDWMMIPRLYISSGNTYHEIVYTTMELRIDILTNDSPDFKYGIYEWELYDNKNGTGDVIPIIEVTFVNR
jgi:hypothetical protein